MSYSGASNLLQSKTSVTVCIHSSLKDMEARDGGAGQRVSSIFSLNQMKVFSSSFFFFPDGIIREKSVSCFGREIVFIYPL